MALAPPDRNPIDFYSDGGLNFQAMIDARPDDSFGFAGSFSKISGDARGADRDVNRTEDGCAIVRDYEASVQATYSFGLLPGLKIQPHVQYVLHPGGHIADPNDPTGRRAIPNALVVGLRTLVKW